MHLSIMDDIIAENEESFFINLDRGFDIDNRIILNPNQAVVTIMDNDGTV